MPPWFQLPAEIRLRTYHYCFGGLVFKPLQQSSLEANTNRESQVPSPSFISLAVSRQWKAEVAPFLLPSATFDFTAHPGDPPFMVTSKSYELMRHVVILETHCFNAEWLDQVFDKMIQVRTMTIRKLRRLGTVDGNAFDGPRITQKFIEKVRVDPIRTLLTGYRFDHTHVKGMLKGKWPERRIFLEGSLWCDRDEEAHSRFHVDLDTWMVKIEGLSEGAESCSIQATEPAPVERAHFEDEEDMFGYQMAQYLTSLQSGPTIYYI